MELLQRGGEAKKKGDYAGAIELFADAKMKDPKNTKAWHSYVACLADQDCAGEYSRLCLMIGGPWEAILLLLR